MVLPCTEWMENAGYESPIGADLALHATTAAAAAAAATTVHTCSAVALDYMCCMCMCVCVCVCVCMCVCNSAYGQGVSGLLLLNTVMLLVS